MSTAPVLMMSARNVSDVLLKKQPEAAVLEFQRSLKSRCGGGTDGARAVRGRCNGSVSVTPSVLPREQTPPFRAKNRAKGWGTQARTLHLVQAAAAEKAAVAPDLAFYRKYTEGMLRRYVRMSMEAGRVPSMLGREMFRARVTGYEVHSFEDVVIFVCDVERCVGTLDELEQKLVRRIGMQEYTVSEVAKTLDMSERTLVRRYNDALDALTAVFLKRGLLFK